jgi:hypothetical protein
MTEQWQELKETITEMRDNDGTGTQQETCKFLVDYMEILEKQMQEPCEDCISREQAINDLKLAYFSKDLQSAKDDPCIVDAMTDWAIRTIKRLPSVTPRIEPCEDCISRKMAVEAVAEALKNTFVEYEDIAKKIIDKLPSVIPQTVTEFADKCKECGKIQNELSEDAVSRSELLSHDFIITAQNGISHRVIYATRVEEAPSVTPERPKGKWIKVITAKDDFGETWHFKCSICGEKSNKGYRPLENYCHNCGAKMEVEK